MKYIITLILVIAILIACISCDEYTPGIVTQKQAIEWLEMAYFEGQLDAINGDIRIGYNADSCIIWKKSPWDDINRTPIYQPLFCK